MTNLLAVVYEVDLYKKWVPFCVENQKLKDISRTARAALIRCDVKGNFPNLTLRLSNIQRSQNHRHRIQQILSQGVHDLGRFFLRRK